MTVAEMIAELQKLPPDLPVVWFSSYGQEDVTELHVHLDPYSPGNKRVEIG